MAEGGWAQNKDKADIVVHMGNCRAFAEAADAVPGAQVIAQRTVPFARHLGGLNPYNNSASREMEQRRMALRAGWARLGSFWTASVRKKTKRAIFLSVVVEAALAGLTAYVPTFRQLQSLTGAICSFLRVLEGGNAFAHEEADKEIAEKLKEDPSFFLGADCARCGYAAALCRCGTLTGGGTAGPCVVSVSSTFSRLQLTTSSKLRTNNTPASLQKQRQSLRLMQGRESDFFFKMPWKVRPSLRG